MMIIGFAVETYKADWENGKGGRGEGGKGHGSIYSIYTFSERGGFCTASARRPW